MDAADILGELNLSGAGYAAPLAGGSGVGFGADTLVTPASVMKIQIALTIESAIAEGRLDGQTPRPMQPQRRTPGPIGVSLMHDEVRMSIRDLVSLMLTISDNVATDELIAVAGLPRINQTTAELGLAQTWITSDLAAMLDALGQDAGFADYSALLAHDPLVDGAPTAQEILTKLAAGSTLDPRSGSRTTAAETVALLAAIWSEHAGPADACAAVRQGMRQQLTRQRIATGFGPEVRTAAKSGGLMGIVRNEAGVVTFPDDTAYAVAVFTRAGTDTTNDPHAIDGAIGQVARTLVDQLRV